MSLRAVIGVGILAVAGYFLWSNRAEASTMTDSITSSGADSAAPVPVGKLAYLAIVRQINDEQFGGWFDPAIVMAVMQQESNFNPTSYRAEPQINDASYGLMQVLLSTARDRGYYGAPDGLYDPATNIALGMAQLKWSFDYLAGKFGTVSEAQWLSAYNAGVGYVSRGGVRSDYVASVQRYKAAWEGVA